MTTLAKTALVLFALLLGSAGVSLEADLDDRTSPNGRDCSTSGAAAACCRPAGI